eukprot:6243874-Pyramimonas_sp.AAC.1
MNSRSRCSDMYTKNWSRLTSCLLLRACALGVVSVMGSCMSGVDVRSSDSQMGVLCLLVATGARSSLPSSS